MAAWSQDELRRIAEADDLHVAPFREDGATYGTPTWIWSVAVDDALYVRGYNGQNSRWYQAAVRQKAGRIIAWTIGGSDDDCDAGELFSGIVRSAASRDLAQRSACGQGYRNHFLDPGANEAKKNLPDRHDHREHVVCRFRLGCRQR